MLGLKGKRGGIPAVNEIVMTILNVLPKPILALLFILLITTISSFVMPMMLNIFGYECVSENGQLKLYKVPLNSLTSKISTSLGAYFGGFIGLKDYELPEDPFPDGDKRFIVVPGECIVTQEINGSFVGGYTYACTNCTTYEPFWFDLTHFTPKDLVCLSDGYTLAQEDIPIWVKQYCYICAPPLYYYFNKSNCEKYYDCYFTLIDDSDLPLIGDSYPNDYYVTNLKKLGAVEIAQDTDEIINIQCSAVNKPDLYVFNFVLFNRTMWVVLLVGGALVSFALKWYGLFM